VGNGIFRTTENINVEHAQVEQRYSLSSHIIDLDTDGQRLAVRIFSCIIVTGCLVSPADLVPPCRHILRFSERCKALACLGEGG
jgi:hypothetical protein